jgi:four helix bundle protein
MQRGEMIERTKRFALRVIRLVSKLPKDRAAEIIGRQLLRSGTSIGANYREAVRAATKKHFTSIMTTALREADESLCWLELLRDSELIPTKLLVDIINECQQLVAILAATVKKASQPQRRATTPREAPSNICYLTSAICYFGSIP